MNTMHAFGVRALYQLNFELLYEMHFTLSTVQTQKLRPQRDLVKKKQLVHRRAGIRPTTALFQSVGQ